MGLPIRQHIPHSDDWVAGLRTLLGALMEGLLDRGDVLVGYVAASGRVYELTREISVGSLLIRVGWFYVANDASVLTSTT